MLIRSVTIGKYRLEIDREYVMRIASGGRIIKKETYDTPEAAGTAARSWEIKLEKEEGK